MTGTGTVLPMAATFYWVFRWPSTIVCLFGPMIWASRAWNIWNWRDQLPPVWHVEPKQACAFPAFSCIISNLTLPSCLKRDSNALCARTQCSRSTSASNPLH